ncbi:hypothetical protein BDV95DRAFT_597864 [Massariosphaeria phaeospora]|uniref:Uncharacterized protein n=1 Tax=Massariosphaeria phaeospora TaxID=100035 RepID=A0A7C8I0R4_9PLEO|nr:hypothetical protein BDV95DRAFT_597864 [Massariosphaeria phaeospora]
MDALLAPLLGVATTLIAIWCASALTDDFLHGRPRRSRSHRLARKHAYHPVLVPATSIDIDIKTTDVAISAPNPTSPAPPRKSTKRPFARNRNRKCIVPLLPALVEIPMGVRPFCASLRPRSSSRRVWAELQLQRRRSSLCVGSVRFRAVFVMLWFCGRACFLFLEFRTA